MLTVSLSGSLWDMDGWAAAAGTDMPQSWLAYLPLSSLPLHGLPLVLQVGQVLLCVAVGALGRHGEELLALVQQLLVELLLGLQGRTQLLQGAATLWLDKAGHGAA